MPKDNNAAQRAVKKNSGLLGRAARALGGRTRKIDAAVDAATSWGDNSKKDVRKK